MNKSDDTDSFLGEMQGIKKLNQDKVLSGSRAKNKKQSLDYRRKAAEKQSRKFQNFLTDGEVEAVEPQEILSHKISGIQPNVFKNLKNARYSFDYHLDLHRMSVSQARQVVYKLISSAEVEEFRCLLITHGKGERSQHPAKLKSYVNHWLKQIEQVIAFHSALAKHGGAGSVYVLLKKPKEDRKINQIKYE